jgi:hypothetical protein
MLVVSNVTNLHADHKGIAPEVKAPENLSFGLRDDLRRASHAPGYISTRQICLRHGKPEGW